MYVHNMISINLNIYVSTPYSKFRVFYNSVEIF